MYDPDGRGIEHSHDFCRIIDEQNFNRLSNLLHDAMEKGAMIRSGGKVDPMDKFISPTVLSNVHSDMEIMKEEIFGPLLPVISYNHLEEVSPLVCSLPKPLTMYIGSSEKGNIDFFLENIPSGSVLINDFLLNFSNPDSPFGGINNSGIGRAGGIHSFGELSNKRSVMKRNWASLNILYPPYNKSLHAAFRRFISWK